MQMDHYTTLNKVHNKRREMKNKIIEKNINKKCECCEGKGYYNLSSSYDDIHSRVPCDRCMENETEIEEYDQK